MAKVWNVGLGLVNLAADAASFTGGSWTVAFPLANLIDRQITKVARSSDALAASTQFTVDLGSAVSIREIELRWHNLSTAATWVIKAGSTSGGAEVFTQSSQSVFLTTPTGITGHHYPALAIFSAAQTARYWTFEFTDTTNTDGYLEFGYLTMGVPFEPDLNYSYGLQDGLVDLSGRVRSAGGGQFFEERDIYRTVQFVMEWLTEAEAKSLHGFMHVNGTTNDVHYIPRMNDVAYSQQFGFLATFEELSPIEYPLPRTRKLPARLTERL